METSEYYRPRMSAVEHHYYLVGDIEEPENYIEAFEALSSASEQDVFHIHINTVGGYMSTVAQFIHHIRKTRAYVITHAEGKVFSGGSLIFFTGHAMEVGELSEFLAHPPAGGVEGKVPDMVDAAKHKKDYAKGFYESIYKPFYSEKEIASILKGKELYETAQQVEKRLIEAKKYFDNEELNDNKD